MKFIKSTSFHITVISPIHIGNGEEIDWTSSVADGDRLYLFDLLRMEKLSEDLSAKIKNISKKCEKVEDVIELQRVYKQHKKKFKESSYASISLPEKLAQHFQDTIGTDVQNNNPGQGGKKDKAINKLAVARTAHNMATSQALIPGSSLKGAIRTAYLASKAKPEHKVGKKLKEDEILGGSFATDPFRLIKVEDAYSKQKNITQIYHVKNFKRRRSDRERKGIPKQLEAIAPFGYREFSAEFCIQNLGENQVEGKNVKAPGIEELMRELNKFSRKLFADQQEQLAKLSCVDQKWLQKTKDLLEKTKNDKNIVLVRLGSLGTAESKTVGEDLREIKIPQNNRHSEKHGTTFWLAGEAENSDHRLPLGWALIEIETDEQHNKPLQEYCDNIAQQLPANAPAQQSAQNTQYDDMPEDPTKIIAWLKGLLDRDGAKKHSKISLQIAEQAREWGDEKYDLTDLLDGDYEFDQSYKEKISDVLESYL